MGRPITAGISLFPLMKNASQLAAILLIATPSAFSATHTWKGSSTNDLWSHGPNWTSGVAPTAAESDVKLIFPASAELNSIDNIPGLTVTQFTVTGAGYSFSGASGAKLTLNGGSGDHFINNPGSSGTTTIAPSLPIVLGGLIVSFANTSGNLSLESVISGAGIMVRRGVGAVAIKGTAANTFTGGLYCQSGVTHLIKSPGVNAIGGGEFIIGDPSAIFPAYVTITNSTRSRTACLLESIRKAKWLFPITSRKRSARSL